MMGRYLTVIPAYGRDYKTAKAARADWNANLDFIIATFPSDPTDGKPISKQDAHRAGLKINIRYSGLTKITQAPSGPFVCRAKKVTEHKLPSVKGLIESIDPTRRNKS